MADQPTFDVAIHLGKILFLILNLESLNVALETIWVSKSNFGILYTE